MDFMLKKRPEPLPLIRKPIRELRRLSPQTELQRGDVLRPIPPDVRELKRRIAGALPNVKMAVEIFCKSLEGQRPLIVTHKNADADAIVAAEALRLQKFPGADIAIYGTPDPVATQIIQHFSIPVRKAGETDFHDYAGVIVVDTDAADMVPKFPEGVPLLAIFNHRSESPYGALVADCLNIKEPRFASTAEIIAHYFPPRTRDVALMLAVGIFSDTDGLREAGGETEKIFGRLLGDFAITRKMVSRLSGDKFTKAECKAIDETLTNPKRLRVNNITVAFVTHRIDDRRHLKALSQKLLRKGGCDFAAAMAEKRNNRGRTLISLKCRESSPLDCSQMMYYLVSRLTGGYGGKKTAAAGAVNAGKKEARAMIEKYVKTNFDSTKGPFSSRVY